MSLGSDLQALARDQFRLSVESRPRTPRQLRSGVCDFCSEPGSDLVVDHDHETGRIRGFVHLACNTAIGAHTKSNVHRLVDYLNRDADLGRYPEVTPGQRSVASDELHEPRDAV
jgi:hypothetical protein